jgi:hypothetical protein
VSKNALEANKKNDPEKKVTDKVTDNVTGYRYFRLICLCVALCLTVRYIFQMPPGVSNLEQLYC